MVIVPDVRGLHEFYELLADALAGAGVHAIAIDYYGRTAGVAYRNDDFRWGDHVAGVTDDGLRGDVRAASGALEIDGIDRTYVLGFCFGGRASLMQASQPGIDGVVAFYGSPVQKPDVSSLSPLEEARRGLARARVLGLFGGADEGIPPQDVEEYELALTEAGIEHELVTYPGAPHSFFDRHSTEYADACADAWRRLLDFIA